MDYRLCRQVYSGLCALGWSISRREMGHECADEVRREAWREAQSRAKELAKADEKHAAKVSEARAKAKNIGSSACAPGKAPENLTENQKTKLEQIALNDPKRYRSFLRKEELRLILKGDDPEEAAKERKDWYWKARHSRIPAMKEQTPREKGDAAQGAYPAYHPFQEEEYRNRGDQSQEEADHEKGIWLPQHREHARYAVSCLPEWEGPSSQPKVKPPITA